MEYLNKILQGDALHVLQMLLSGSVDCCVTSPPYWGLRNYEIPPTIWPEVRYKLFGFEVVVPAMECCLGLEKTPFEFVAHLVLILREVKRVLKPRGIAWVNMGDSYCSTAPGTYSAPLKQTGILSGVKDETANARKQMRNQIPSGCKPKDLVGVPWMLAFALREDGWYLRSDIIWHKRNPMPESVTDRPTKAHEYVFLLAKSADYYYDAEAIKEAGKNPQDDLRRILSQQSGNKSNPDEKVNGLRPRTSGNKSHKYVSEYESSETELHRTKAGLLDISATAYAKANKRSVWSINTSPFPEAHFATFPDELPELCIKAGSSERGCCAGCGEPWERQLSKASKWEERKSQGEPMRYVYQNDTPCLTDKIGTTETIGWAPTCKCPAGGGIVPSVILDPFSGAATTFMVARKLNRNAIGIELNPEYIGISERRLKKEFGMFYNPIHA